MTNLVGKVVMPGDVMNFDVGEKEQNKTNLILGPGIEQISNEIIATKPGILKRKDTKIYWIDGHQKRYVPVKGDYVIGVVTSKAGDIFRVDIGSNDSASLSFLSFEGASKRNRPDVKVGDILYTQLITANRHMESELTCVDGNGKCAGMGVIRKGGFMFTCSLNLCRKLLCKDSTLLQSLGSLAAFESAIGLNGRVWINARSSRETVAITNAICAAEFMSKEQIKAMCKKLGSVLSGFG